MYGRCRPRASTCSPWSGATRRRPRTGPSGSRSRTRSPPWATRWRCRAWWSDAAQGGGWLGAQGSHAVDQVRTALGEFAGVSAHLPVPPDRPWTAEDGYLVHFRLRNGVVGVLQSMAGDYGPLLVVNRI